MIPRSSYGSHWRVIASITEAAKDPGARSALSWRSACATPTAISSSPTNATRSQRLTPIPGVSQRRRFTVRSPLELAVEDRHRAEIALAQPRGELLRDHDRAVEAAGAPDGDREPRLALV